jgi:phosphonate transport system ATP-binding protein
MTIAAAAEGIAAMEESGRADCALSVRDVSFSYDGRRQVLDGVSVALGRGQVAMLLGRSGSGKTTLLKLIQGVLQPQAGSIAVNPGGAGGTHRAAVAWVPQTLGLVRGMSALDNTLVGALARTNSVLSLARVFPGRLVREAEETLALVGLSDTRQQPVARLSGGERQRVALARALMQKPELILADEFVSQLDPVTTHEILSLMRQVAQAGVSFLVTTHEIEAVVRFSDRVLLVRDGKVVHDGPSGVAPVPRLMEMLV